MQWIKRYLKGRHHKTKKFAGSQIETPEEIIKRITREYNDNPKPLTLEKSGTENNYTIIDENGIRFSNEDGINFAFGKNTLLRALNENNNDIKQAFHSIIKITKESTKEAQIQWEVSKLKAIEQRKLIREEAEKRLYGKVKENTRSPISERDKDIIFNKFGNECSICNRKEGLHIHHKDHNPSNNRLDNLILLCGVCHKKIHMKVR